MHSSFVLYTLNHIPTETFFLNAQHHLQPTVQIPGHQAEETVPDPPVEAVEAVVLREQHPLVLSQHQHLVDAPPDAAVANK